MKTLHRVLMTGMLAALLAVGVGAVNPSLVTAEAQHGQAGHHAMTTDAEAHFGQLAERLELTPEQRDSLRGTFDEAFAVMQEMHRLHGVIEAGLTSDQNTKFMDMMHEMMGGSMSHESMGQPLHDGGHN